MSKLDSTMDERLSSLVRGGGLGTVKQTLKWSLIWLIQIIPLATQ